MQKILKAGRKIDPGFNITQEEIKILPNDVEEYTGVTATGGDVTFTADYLALKPGDGDATAFLAKNAEIAGGDAPVTIKRMTGQADPVLLANLSEMDGVVDDPCAVVKDGAALAMFDVSSMADGASFRLGKIEAAGRVGKVAGVCSTNGYLSLSDLSIDTGEKSVEIENFDSKVMTPAEAGLPTRPSGVTYAQDYSLSGVSVRDSAGDQVFALGDLEISSSFDADSGIALGKTGLYDAMEKVQKLQMAGEPVDPAIMGSVDTVSVYNAAIRTIFHSTSTVDDLSLMTKESVSPQLASLQSFVGDNILADASFKLDQNAGRLEVTLDKDLKDLAAISVKIALEFDEVDSLPEGVDPGALLMSVPARLAMVEVSFDEKGLDDVVRAKTGSGIIDMIQSAPIPMKTNLDLTSDWLRSGMGAGNVAYLKVQPDTPMPVRSAVPMLMSDWAQLGPSLGATVSR